MAKVVETLATFGRGGGGASITATYDDVLLLVINLSAQNTDAARTLVLTFDSPRSFAQTLHPGESLDLPLAGAARLVVARTADYHGNIRFSGLIWSATLGL